MLSKIWLSRFPTIYKEMIFSSKYYFARNLSTKMSYRERKIFQQESKPSETIDKHKEEDRLDPKSLEVDDFWMAKAHLGVQHLPERLLKRTQQVFNKFEAGEIRKMGKSYMKLYQLLHANERPTDLMKIKQPFSNTDDLAKENKAIVYLGKQKKVDGEKVESEKPERTKKSQLGERLDKNENVATEENSNSTETDGSDKIKQDYGIQYEKNVVLAYLLRKMPHTFGVACRVFTEIKYRLPEFKPKTFLDFGAGLGSGSWAFHDTFPPSVKIVAVEPSVGMRKIGKHLTQDISNMVWIDSLGRIISIPEIETGFDFIYCGYVLEEAKSAHNRQLIIETLWQKLNPNGIMVLIEPGSPKGFRFVHDFREWIRSKPRPEASIISPCPHHKECPLAKPAHLWCNFEQAIAKYPKSVFPKLPKERTVDLEKFSHLVVKKGESITNKQEAKTPAEKSFFWSRILRPIMKRDRHLILDLCNTEGELERIIVAKSHGEESGYKHAKRLRWGDFWLFPKRIPNKYRKESRKGKRLW